jgi:hypothetical protein
MTVLFKNLRTIAYGKHNLIVLPEPRERTSYSFFFSGFVLLLSGSVLGIASYFASHFLPHIRRQLPVRRFCAR